MKITEATIQMWIDELKEIKGNADGFYNDCAREIPGEHHEFISDGLCDIDNEIDLLIGKMERTIT